MKPQMYTLLSVPIHAFIGFCICVHFKKLEDREKLKR